MRAHLKSMLAMAAVLAAASVAPANAQLIIQVPQADDDAPVRSQPRAAVQHEDFAAPVARRQPAPPRAAAAVRPRRNLTADTKRTVLAAPETGTLSPIYPTPRWRVTRPAAAPGESGADLPAGDSAVALPIAK